jgi:hypothetical protein
MSKIYKKIDSYYKNAKEDIQKKLDITKEYQYTFVEENGKHIVEINSNNKLKLKAEYNIVGLYNIPVSVWYWSWSLPFVNKKLLEKVNIVKDFPQKLEKQKDFNKISELELEELYFLTSNNNFYCSGKNIDRIISLVLYLTEALWYFPVKIADETSTYKMERIEYIIITKILQFN